MAETTSQPTGTGRLVEYLHSEDRTSVPPAVDTAVKRRIIDTLAATTAGHQFADIETATAYTASTFGSGNVTVLDGAGTTLNGPGATLANTLAANELDVDDGNRLAQGHPAAVILPAAVTAAESRDASIGDLLDAFLPAYEIAVRTAMAMHDWIGMHTGSGSWGAVGAAAAASRLRGFDRETAADALGIAEYNAPITPVMRSVARPAGSMTKDGIGWGGFVGYTATDLAERGFGGSGTLYDEIEYEGLDRSHLDTLGDRYHITEGYYKPYPACRWIHPSIDAVRSLHETHDIAIGDIQAVHVYTHPKGASLGIRRPTTASEAEYSYPFIVAQAIRNGGAITAEDLKAAALSAPETLALADLVELHVDQEAANRYPEEALARVEIETADEQVGTDLINPRGSKERPMSEAEQEAKWRTLLDEYLGEGTTEFLIEAIEDEDAPIDTLLEPWQA